MSGLLYLVHAPTWMVGHTFFGLGVHANTVIHHPGDGLVKLKSCQTRSKQYFSGLIICKTYDSVSMHPKDMCDSGQPIYVCLTVCKMTAYTILDMVWPSSDPAKSEPVAEVVYGTHH